MLLLASTLAAELIRLDEPTSPTTPEETAEAWFKAWWAYASQMSYWNPLFLSAAELAARTAFIPALVAGCYANPIPGTFYLALELACIAGMVAASAVPLALLPAFVPPLVPPPVPGALVVALVATVPIGLLMPAKEPVRSAMALAIDIWMHLFMITPSAGPPTVPIV